MTENPGSSPLTRGKRAKALCSRDAGGLIPAHAGKTVHQATAGALIRAHPRSRGENREHRQEPKSCGGSSPLTRGKRYCGVLARRAPGLIPAHAGKTL